MVILGAYIAYTLVLPKNVVTEALPAVIRRKNLIPLNEKAIEEGMAYAGKIQREAVRN